MRFAVIGAGNTGKAVTAYLKKEGQEVVLYCRNAQLAQQLCQGLTAQGAVEGKFEVKATSNLAEAVRGAQVILVQTVASGHAPVAQALKGLLEPGQIILIFNGVMMILQPLERMKDMLCVEPALIFFLLFVLWNCYFRRIFFKSLLHPRFARKKSKAGHQSEY